MTEGRDCLVCGKWKERSAFSTEKGGLHGLRATCRLCRRDARYVRGTEPKTNTCKDCGALITDRAMRCRSCFKRGELNHNFHNPAAAAQVRVNFAMTHAVGRSIPERQGSGHPMWKGDAATIRSGRQRARRAYLTTGPCQVCGNQKAERHHVDGNTRDNSPENVLMLCRPHHRRIHPGNGRWPIKAVPPEYLEAIARGT